MNVSILSRDEFKEISDDCFISSFGDLKSKDIEACNFAIVYRKENELMAFVTCIEMDKEDLYWQYGGALEKCKSTVHSYRIMEDMLRLCLSDYQRVSFKVENSNFPMINLAMGLGFLVKGLSKLSDKVFLELSIERNEWRLGSTSKKAAVPEFHLGEF